MARDGSQQTHNLVSIIHAYLWRRVTVVSEVDPDGGDTGSLSTLTEALQKIGSQIEHHIVLPRFSPTANSKTAVKEAFSKFLNESCYSRVFVVLKVSLPYVSHLFEEAKGMGLMGNDSAWIVTETITDLLPCCLDPSTVQSMEGALGLMTKFDNTTRSFQVFQARFRIRFSEEHPEENGHDEPSFHALLAYDAITTIATAITRLNSKSATNLKQGPSFLREILRSNFTGLSGHISFDQDDNTLLNQPDMKIVNIVGRNYREILDLASEDIEDDAIAKNVVTEAITWPGNLKGDVPKGWMMPTQKKPMKIGVPVIYGYNNLMDYQSDKKCVTDSEGNITSENEKYCGFCPQLFREVLNVLGYELPYQFIQYRRPYDELIQRVYNKSLDAIVGDVTILANRTELVEFTLPYEESGLSIILPVVEPYNSHDPWIFLRPFTTGMWLLTLALLVYTMVIVWCLEQKENDEFNGPFRDQISTIVWFTFCSLFFAQREKISGNLARVVVVTWLFVVMVLTQSYTANLTSMLTSDRLNQTTVDIEMLKRSNAKVGYDNSSFVNKFLEDHFQFDPTNIVGIVGEFEEFHRQFQAGNITAAFLDVLDAKFFVTQYCNKYTITNPRYRFGGLAFAFPKGSPVARDVSQAILKLTENGMLNNLERDLLKINNECYTFTDEFSGNDVNGDENSSLKLHSFWVLFVFSVATSTLSLLAFLLSSWQRRRVTPLQDGAPATTSVELGPVQ